MEVIMPIHFDRFGHDAALEIVHVGATSADGEVRVRAIDCSDNGGVAAKSHGRIGGQAVITKVFCVSLIVDLGKDGTGAANVNRQAGAGTDDDLRAQVPLHQDIARNIQHSVAVDVHDLFRLQRETGHQIIVTA